MSLNQHPECMHQLGDFQEEADKGKARMGNTFLCTQKQFCFTLIHRFNSVFDTINNWPRTLCETSRASHGSQTSSTTRFPEFRLVVCLSRLADCEQPSNDTQLAIGNGYKSSSPSMYGSDCNMCRVLRERREQVAEEALCLCSLARLRCGGSSVALLRSPGHRQHTTHTAHTAYSDNTIMQRKNLMCQFLRN